MTPSGARNATSDPQLLTITPHSAPSCPSAITLLYGLVAFDQIRMHKIDGHRQVKALITQTKTEQHEGVECNDSGVAPRCAGSQEGFS